MKDQNSMIDRFPLQRRLMMLDFKNQSMNVSPTEKSGFPKTTNEDFHNDEIFKKMAVQRQKLAGKELKFNKEKSEFLTFVDAAYNCGVFSQPKAS